jgi:hypothetical protein
MLPGRPDWQGGVAVAGSGRAQGADEIRDVTRRRIEIFGDAGDGWPFAASLKSITEDTAQEYKDRAVLELIQNGHDAIGSDSSGRIHILLKLDGAPDHPEKPGKQPSARITGGDFGLAGSCPPRYVRALHPAVAGSRSGLQAAPCSAGRVPRAATGSAGTAESNPPRSASRGPTPIACAAHRLQRDTR